MEDKAPTARRASKRVPRRPGRYDDHDQSIDQQRQPKRRKKGKEDVPEELPTDEKNTSQRPDLICLLKTGKKKVDDRLMRAVERDFRLLDGEVRPAVPHCDGEVRPPGPYNLRSWRRCPVNTGQDTRVRILDGPLPVSEAGHEMAQALPASDGGHVPPTEDELEVAQALSSLSVQAQCEVDDHKMSRADSKLQSQLKEAAAVLGADIKSVQLPMHAMLQVLSAIASMDVGKRIATDKQSPSAAELQQQLVEETPVPLTPAVPAPRRAVARSRRGKIRARSLSQPQRNPATRTFPPVARRRADYHTAQEEAGHPSHAPVSDIVSDASDDLEVEGAMLSEEAALRDGEDFIMSDRVVHVHCRKTLPKRSPQGIGSISRTIIGPGDHLGQRMLQSRLENCLRCWSRRWVAYEFFYSAMDRPFFMHNEFLSYLRNIGIPPSTKLTRTEWSVLRAFSGHPRRLSWAFLEQERIKLEKFRRKVRLAYATQGAKILSNMPRPLKVGQRVVARHPQNRQLLDGKILTASSDSYRVQFDSWEQGVQVVKDVDIMPADPSENLPPSLLATQPPALVNGRLATTAAVRAQRLGVLDSLRPSAPAQGAPDVLPMSVVSQPSVDGKGQAGEGYQLMLPVENPLPTWQDIRLEATRILRTAQMDGNHEQKDQAQLSEEANAKHLLLTGCTAIWMILQKAAAAPMPPQVLISLLQEAYVLMKPKHATNQQTFLKIQQTVSDILKPHLEGNEICRCDPNL